MTGRTIRFFRPERTMVDPLQGIVQQFGAAGTQIPPRGRMMPPAVDPDHPPHHPSLVSYRPVFLCHLFPVFPLAPAGGQTVRRCANHNMAEYRFSKKEALPPAYRRMLSLKRVSDPKKGPMALPPTQPNSPARFFAPGCHFFLLPTQRERRIRCQSFSTITQVP